MSYSWTSEGLEVSFQSSKEEREKDEIFFRKLRKACEKLGTRAKFMNGSCEPIEFRGVKIDPPVDRSLSVEELCSEIENRFSQLMRKTKEAQLLADWANEQFAKIQKESWKGKLNAVVKDGACHINGWWFRGEIGDIQSLENHVQKCTGVSLRWMMKKVIKV